jgi:hypothetical protein
VKKRGNKQGREKKNLKKKTLVSRATSLVSGLVVVVVVVEALRYNTQKQRKRG